MTTRTRLASVQLFAFLLVSVDTLAQQPSEILIRDGVIVTAEGRSEGDIRIRGGAIVEIGESLPAADGTREIFRN